MKTMTADEARDAALRQAYRVVYYNVLGELTAITQLVTEEYPDPDGDARPTRYHVDALRDLAGRLSALVWSYERRT